MLLPGIPEKEIIGFLVRKGDWKNKIKLKT
jgi:hypothetical protein